MEPELPVAAAPLAVAVAGDPGTASETVGVCALLADVVPAPAFPLAAEISAFRSHSPIQNHHPSVNTIHFLYISSTSPLQSLYIFSTKSLHDT